MENGMFGVLPQEIIHQAAITHQSMNGLLEKLAKVA
jgi:hypothetical protein